MNINPAHQPADRQVAEQTPPAPLGGTRAEAIQRLQIGLFGLTAMILMVALASIIMDAAKKSEATAVPEAAATSSPDPVKSASASDPLVDAGVVPNLPGRDAEDEEASSGAGGKGGTARSPSR